MTITRPSDLPASTIQILGCGQNDPFPVAVATKWADAVIALGFEPPELFEIYNLDDSEGYECSRLVRQALTNIVTWPETPIANLAICRDIALGAFMRDELTAERFAAAAFAIACDLRYLISEDEFQAGGPLASDIQSFYTIDHFVDPPIIPGYVFEDLWNPHGFDPKNPRAWIIPRLKEWGMIDHEGQVIPATWHLRR